MTRVSLADYLTILAAADLPPSGYEKYHAWIVIRPNDDVREWVILGEYEDEDGTPDVDEVHGPFSTRKAALHFLTHSLQRIAPRAFVVVG